MTHCESQRQGLSRVKHETFNKWLASIVYANVKDTFSLFPGTFFVKKQYSLFLRIILEGFKLYYFFLMSNTCDEYFAVRTQISSDASSCYKTFANLDARDF